MNALRAAFGAVLLACAFSCQGLLGIERLSAESGSGGGGGAQGGGGAGGASCAEPCYAGPKGTADVGVCRTGCEEEAGQCAGEVLPGVEICASDDDENCDGERGCTGKFLWTFAVETVLSGATAYFAIDPEGFVWTAGAMYDVLYAGDRELHTKGKSGVFVLKLDPGTHKILEMEAIAPAEENSDFFVTAIKALPGGDIVLAGVFFGTLELGDDVLEASGYSSFLAVLDGGTGKAKRGFALIAGDETSEVDILDMAVDASGAIAVVGRVLGTATADAGITLISQASSFDAFVARVDAEDGFVDVLAFGSEGSETALWVDANAEGDLVVAGVYDGPGFEVGSELGASIATDFYVARFSQALEPRWAKGFGGDGRVNVAGVAFDRSSGRIVVGGVFDGHLDTGTVSLESKGSTDLFLAELEADGKVAWFKTFGDASAQAPLGLAVDRAGQITLAGAFAGTLAFDDCSVKSTSGEDAEDADAFLAKFHPDGTTAWCKRGSASDGAGAAAWSVLNGPDGGVYVTGWFENAFSFTDGGLVTCDLLPCLFFSRLSP